MIRISKLVIASFLVTCLTVSVVYGQNQKQHITEAQKSFQKGISAASHNDFERAEHYFQNSVKYYENGSPYIVPADVYLDLGLAASNVPGEELVALAAFEIYLSQGTSNLKAVRKQIDLIDSSFKTRLNKLLDKMGVTAKALRKYRQQGLYAFETDDAIRVDIAKARAFLGDVRPARELIRSNSIDRNYIWGEESDSGDLSLAGAMISAGVFNSLPTPPALSGDDAIGFALERNRFDLAFKIFTSGALTSSSVNDALELMCDATLRKDRVEVEQVILYVKSNLAALQKKDKYYGYNIQSGQLELAKSVMMLGYPNDADELAKSLTSKDAQAQWIDFRTFFMTHGAKTQDESIYAAIRIMTSPSRDFLKSTFADKTLAAPWWGQLRLIFLDDEALDDGKNYIDRIDDAITESKANATKTPHLAVGGVIDVIMRAAALYRMIHGPFDK